MAATTSKIIPVSIQTRFHQEYRLDGHENDFDVDGSEVLEDIKNDDKVVFEFFETRDGRFVVIGSNLKTEPEEDEI